MTLTPEHLIAGLTALVAGLGGFLVAYLAKQREVTLLHEDKARLQAQLDAERQATMARLRSFAEAREQLQQTFKALAGDVLRSNSSEFLKLAQSSLHEVHTRAEGDLARQRLAVESLVKPIQQALEKTGQQVHEMEKDRQQAFGSLTRHLQELAQTQQLLHSETRNLGQALRRPEVRGQWGELTLKRLVELAGMSEHCDFVEQETLDSDQGPLRPDMIVRMSDAREIVIDAKTPLDAYLSAVDAPDDRQRQHHLQRYARHVRDRVRELSGKHYWRHLPRSPEFVVLFIPGDQFLDSALQQDARLLEDALSSKVILATPTSLVALLRTLAYGWRQKVLAENAEEIRRTGEDLYERLAKFSEHLGRLGRSLGGSVEAFNRAVGAFDNRVLPGVRRFTEMGVRARSEVEALNQVETLPRTVESEAESRAGNG